MLRALSEEAALEQLHEEGLTDAGQGINHLFGSQPDFQAFRLFGSLFGSQPDFQADSVVPLKPLSFELFQVD